MINLEQRSFLKKAFLFCLLLFGLYEVMFAYVLNDYSLKIFPLQFAVIAAVTILSHLKLMKSYHQNARRFSTTYMSVMSVKLLIYMMFILVCLLIDRSRAVIFVAIFLTLYLFFTIFEVIEISNFFKKNPKTSN
jgi:L-asparagine transporter-like permease